MLLYRRRYSGHINATNLGFSLRHISLSEGRLGSDAIGRQRGAAAPDRPVGPNRSGEQDAFRTVYVLTSAKLFGICLRICGDRAAAEDVLHDVYMIVWKRAGTYEPCLGSPISWLATIARNRAIDWRRSQTRQAAVPLDDSPDLPDPTVDAEAGMLLDEAARGVFACLAALESHQGNAIRNAFFHGFTYAELAERNRVPIGTMKSWIRRGLRQMRHNLEVAGH